MDNLSGGEKTVAALALLFSIHRYSGEALSVLMNDCVLLCMCFLCFVFLLLLFKPMQYWVS